MSLWILHAEHVDLNCCRKAITDIGTFLENVTSFTCTAILFTIIYSPHRHDNGPTSSDGGISFSRRRRRNDLMGSINLRPVRPVRFLVSKWTASAFHQLLLNSMAVVRIPVPLTSWETLSCFSVRRRCPSAVGRLTLQTVYLYRTRPWKPYCVDVLSLFRDPQRFRFPSLQLLPPEL